MTTGDKEAIGGRYALGPVIGRGAMADVHTAEDLRLARPVAIKLLHPILAEQPESRLRFEEEARAAARLSDRNVVAIFDTDEHLGRPYIVMELLPGRTLRDELLDGPMVEARARELLFQVLRALRAAHDAGLIHRDIKPANILLTASGEAKVADFGIAKGAESSDLTATGLVVGTPSYLAPECVTGGAASVGSDLYSVGVVFYEALSGRKPFAGDNPLAVCHAICTDDPPPLRDLRPDLSPELVAVVTKAMAKDPQGRYRSASEMMDSLDHEAVPAIAPADEDTLAVDAVGVIVDPMRTQVHDAVGAHGVALLPSGAPNRRSRRDQVRAYALVGVALLAVLIGVGLFLNVGTHRADTSTNTQPVKSVTTVSAATTTTQPTTTPPTGTPITTSPPPTPTSTSPTTTPPTTTPPTTTPPTTTPPTTTPPTTTPPTTTPPNATTAAPGA